MTSPTAGVLLYAIVVAASPLALAATLVVLGSGRGRLNGITFATGFVLGQAVVYVPAFLIASASVKQRGSGHPTLASILELALGALLLGSAWRVRQRRRRGIERRGPSPRTRVLLDRLTRLSPAAAFGAGAVLGFGGPKRFVITILAATTVSTSGLGAEAKLVISAVYILIATMLVSVPVRGLRRRGGARRRLDHQRPRAAHDVPRGPDLHGAGRVRRVLLRRRADPAAVDRNPAEPGPAEP